MNTVLRYSNVLHLHQRVCHKVGDTMVRTSRFTHSLQHCLKQSSVSLDSSDLLGALRPCLADQDSMLGKCTCRNSAVVYATVTTQGLWPTSPTDPQTDKAIQTLSARRRTVSLSQQYYLLESSTQVENVQAQVRFIGNVHDFQNIDAEIPT